jgi:hypothetical protein
MTQGNVRQVILAGEVLSLRMSTDAEEFEAVESYARSVLDRLVKLDSPEVKKQILLSVLVLASEVVKLRRENARMQKTDDEIENRLRELSTLIAGTLEDGTSVAELRTPT